MPNPDIDGINSDLSVPSHGQISPCAGEGAAELDAVVGRHQLPDFLHLHDLPYIQAAMMGLLRWQPALPLGELKSVSLPLVITDVSAAYEVCHTGL